MKIHPLCICSKLSEWQRIVDLDRIDLFELTALRVVQYVGDIPIQHKIRVNHLFAVLILSKEAIRRLLEVVLHLHEESYYTRNLDLIVNCMP